MKRRQAGLDQLLRIAGPALAPPAAPQLLHDIAALGANHAYLMELLSQRNGCVAFHGALQIFPLGQGCQGLECLQAWNASQLWRNTYPSLDSELLFFAEDVFGGQFALSADQIFSFDPETGALHRLGADLETWAEEVLLDWDYLTGASLAEEWQQHYGALPHGQRLIPLQPFVLGGDFVLENLLLCPRVSAMRARGRIASVIQGLPDGSDIVLDDYPPQDAVRPH